MSRSAWYAAKNRPVRREEQELKAKIDRIYTDQPSYGSRRIVAALSLYYGLTVNRKRVRSLMRKMGIAGVVPKRSLSKPAPGHKVFPYLLRNVKVTRVNQVWSTDITYVPMGTGHLYLVAVIDWYSRRVLSWNLSNTLDASFCVEALQEALRHGTPEVFNTDQGSQFTSESFVNVLQQKGIRISMDGRGRALDNVFVERLWRTVKYEDIYLREYQTPVDVYQGLRRFFAHYNERRPHQALGYRTPDAVYQEAMAGRQAG